MKAEGIFISTLLVIDTFLVSFYFGFNSRHVLVVDPSLPPLVKPRINNSSAKSSKSEAESRKTEIRSPAKSGTSDNHSTGHSGTAKNGKSLSVPKKAPPKVDGAKKKGGAGHESPLPGKKVGAER